MKIAWYELAMFVFAIGLLSFKNDNRITLKEFKVSGFAQGTTYHITYYAENNLVVNKQIDSILDKIDSSLSIYKSYSLISKFNDADVSVEMDEHLSNVVNLSLEIYKATKGVSDITVYPLKNLWGFGPQHSSEKPDSSGISSLMPCIGSKKIHVRGNRLVKDIHCVKIDVNGIAQKYSVDVVAGFLEKKGIQNYIVEIGGELRIRGHKQPGNTFMKIRIESPAVNSFEDPIIKTIIQLDHGAITTSGNYRKYIEKEGKVYSHLMDSKTGYPFQNELISVTVYAENAITADGYDNALMGMGLKKGLLFMKKHKEMEAYFIYHNSAGTVSDTASAGFYKMIKN